MSDRIRRDGLAPCKSKKHEWVAEIIELAEGWAIEPRCVRCFISGSPDDVSLPALLDTIARSKT